MKRKGSKIGRNNGKEGGRKGRRERYFGIESMGGRGKRNRKDESW